MKQKARIVDKTRGFLVYRPGMPEMNGRRTVGSAVVECLASGGGWSCSEGYGERRHFNRSGYIIPILLLQRRLTAHRAVMPMLTQRKTQRQRRRKRVPDQTPLPATLNLRQRQMGIRIKPIQFQYLPK